MIYEGKVRGKDDFIVDTLVPWAVDNNIQSVADVGCDWGKYGLWMRQELALDNLGMYDLSDKTINNLNKNLKESDIEGINTSQWDIELRPLPKKYDLVLAIDLIEHFVDLFKGWGNLLLSGKYVYTLIPKDRSFTNNR